MREKWAHKDTGIAHGILDFYMDFKKKANEFL